MLLSVHWNRATPVWPSCSKLPPCSGAANGLMGEMVEIHLKDELVTGETTPDQRAVRMAEVGHLLRSYLK